MSTCTCALTYIVVLPARQSLGVDKALPATREQADLGLNPLIVATGCTDNHPALARDEHKPFFLLAVAAAREEASELRLVTGCRWIWAGASTGAVRTQCWARGNVQIPQLEYTLVVASQHG